METQHKPRYRWESPQDWLGDRINELLHEAQGGRLSLAQDAAISGLATIANTIVNGTLNVDSDSVQDAFQDDMEDAGYFIDLDKPIPVLFELEPIGSAGTLEATATRFFCSVACRSKFETDLPTKEGEFTASSPEIEKGTVCEECGEVLA